MKRDTIWDREVETETHDAAFARASAAWEEQFHHLMDHSSFYQRKFRNAGITQANLTLNEIARLPFSTKDELKGAVDEKPPFGSNLCVAPEMVKRVYQTSGTSGAPSVLALTRADMEMWTTVGTRTYFATGIHEDNSVLTTFGAGPFVAGHTHFVLSRIGCRSVPVAPGDTDRVIFGLKSGLADTLLSTPSFAQYLANKPEMVGSKGMQLTHIVTGGEPGGGIPAIREHIQNALDVTVTEVMGIGDVAPSLFGECPRQQGMHFCGGGHVWVELVDPDSREPMTIEAGAVGELVYTHLARERCRSCDSWAATSCGSRDLCANAAERRSGCASPAGATICSSCAASTFIRRRSSRSWAGSGRVSPVARASCARPLK